MLDLSKEKLEFMINALWSKIVNKLDNYYTKSDIDEIISNSSSGFSICEWYVINNNNWKLTGDNFYITYRDSEAVTTTVNADISLTISIPNETTTKIRTKSSRRAYYLSIHLNGEKIFGDSTEDALEHEYILHLKSGVNNLTVSSWGNDSSYTEFQLFNIGA